MAFEPSHFCMPIAHSPPPHPADHAQPSLPSELQIFAHAQFDPEEYVNAVCRESSAGTQIRQKLQELISLQALAKASLLHGAQEQTGTYIAATNKIRATARELNALVRQLEHFGQGLADLDEALADALGEEAPPPRWPYVRVANGFDKRPREEIGASESPTGAAHTAQAHPSADAPRQEAQGLAASDADQGVRWDMSPSHHIAQRAPSAQPQREDAEKGRRPISKAGPQFDEDAVHQNRTPGMRLHSPDSTQDRALRETPDEHAKDKPRRNTRPDLPSPAWSAASTAGGDDRVKKDQARSPPRSQARWRTYDKPATSKQDNGKEASTSADTPTMDETDDDYRSSIEQGAVDTIDQHLHHGRLGLAVAQWLRLSRDLRKKKKGLNRDAIEELGAELEARKKPLATAVEAASLLDRDALRLFGLCRNLREAARRESKCDDEVPLSARLVLGDSLEVQRNLRAKDAMLHVLGRKHRLEARLNHLQPCLDALRRSDPSRFWDGLALALEDTFQLFKSSDQKKAAKLSTALIDFAKANLNKFVVDIADELLADVAHLTDKRTALASTARLTRLIKAGSKVLDATAAASSWPPALAAKPLLLDILAPKIANALVPAFDITPAALQAALGDAQLADAVLASRAKLS